MEERNESLRNRVLILTPVGRDGDLARSVLQQDQLAAEICSGVEDLCAKLNEGAGAAVIADEALNAVNLPSLADWVRTQSAWSDFPFIILNHRVEVVEGVLGVEATALLQKFFSQRR